MLLGIVSNCWKVQLADGVELDALLEAAQDEGYRCIELRQGALGKYERGAQLRPDVTELARLSQGFPKLRFNIALALPCLGGALRPDEEMFQLGIAAAQALAGDGACHLRLVDLATSPDQFRQIAEADSAARLAELAAALADAGGMLSVENAKQDWRRFITVFRTARELLDNRASALKLCFDACNLLQAADHPDPTVAARELTPQMTAMIHFKQSQGGVTLPTVCDGDIDWNAQLAHWNALGYDGPALFEIAAHANVGLNLAASRKYVEAVGR